jgi:prepilin-type N-terminal cleavage/methylation domain-containing protein
MRIDRRAGFTLIEVLVTMVVLSIGAMAVMKYATQTQEVSAEISHLDTMSRLAVVKLVDLEDEGLTSSFSRDGFFEDYPGYRWSAKSSAIMTGGWYRMEVVVVREDSGRSVTVERVFRELL